MHPTVQYRVQAIDKYRKKNLQYNGRKRKYTVERQENEMYNGETGKGNVQERDRKKEMYSGDTGKGNFKKRRRASKGHGTQARSLSSLAYNCT